ncbi:hypothetical protein ABZP36_028393 [Zizania latifolia]
MASRCCDSYDALDFFLHLIDQVDQVQALKDFFNMLTNDSAQACYGPKHVDIANDRLAIQTLLIYNRYFVSCTYFLHCMPPANVSILNHLYYTLAFVRAWMTACASAGSPAIVVPRGNYLLHPLVFRGPCKGYTEVHRCWTAGGGGVTAWTDAACRLWDGEWLLGFT